MEDFSNEAQIAARYKKMVSNPKRIKKSPISQFHLSISTDSPKNNEKLQRKGIKTDRNEEDKIPLTFLNQQNLDSLQRPQTSKPKIFLSKDSAEYQEVPFQIMNKEYERFKNLLQEKVVDNKKIPKYEKRNLIHDIIENEYNFNKYGESSTSIKRKRSFAGNNARSTSKTPRTPGLSHNMSNQPFKKKIVFSFLNQEEDFYQKTEIARFKKDKHFFEEIRKKYLDKIKLIFDENKLNESKSLASREMENLLNDYKEYVERNNEEK